MQNETLCKRQSDLDRVALFVARPNTLVEVKAKTFFLRLGDKETSTLVDTLAETQKEVKAETLEDTLCDCETRAHVNTLRFKTLHQTKQWLTR